MTLQFDPSVYGQIYQNAQNRSFQQEQQNRQMLQDSVDRGIGAIGEYGQQQKQARMDQLMTALKLKEQGIDPGPALDYLRTGQFPQQGDNGPSFTDNSSLMPSFRPQPGQGQMASAGVSDVPMAPRPARSPVIDAWQTTTQGNPNHPYVPRSNQRDGFSSIFKTQSIDMSRVNDPNYLVSLPEKQRGIVEKQNEFQQREKDRQESAALRKSMMTLNVGTKEDQQQDKLEQNAKQSVTNLRGDRSLARAEEQRDAAIIAYNRLNEIEKTGKPPNPIDYVDILGQIYKARTGSAPTNEIFEQARQDTVQGNFGKWYTYFTGQQAPATTQNIASSLKSMAASMGLQADKLHEGYMKSHLIKPKGLNDDRWQPIFNSGRGISFQEATGYSPDTENQGKATQVPTITTQAQYNALPSGSIYMDSNGRRARKK